MKMILAHCIVKLHFLRCESRGVNVPHNSLGNTPFCSLHHKGEVYINSFCPKMLRGQDATSEPRSQRHPASSEPGSPQCQPAW